MLIKLSIYNGLNVSGPYPYDSYISYGSNGSSSFHLINEWQKILLIKPEN